jgi:hypothetical protein
VISERQDYLSENNPVRAIDVFVEGLNLGRLGFGGVEPEATGRPAYHPATLLKIYVYGYLNRVQSSRHDKILDGSDALPDENAQKRQHRNGTARPGLQYETGNEHSGRWRVDGSDPHLMRVVRASAAPARPRMSVFLHTKADISQCCRSNPTYPLTSHAGAHLQLRRRVGSRKAPGLANNPKRWLSAEN